MTITAEIEERISKCQKILDVDPNSQIFAALAEAFRKKGELDKAFRICQTGLRIHPSYGSAHIVMAKINLDRGLYDWAEAEVKKAIDLDGRSRAIDLLLAEIYIYKGEFDQAVKLLNALHQSDPANKQIKKLLDIAVRLPEEQKAARVLPETPTDHQEPQPIEPDSDEQSLGSEEFMQRAMQIPEVTGLLFIDLEGLVVASEWGLSIDAELCGATMADAAMHLDQELLQHAFGRASTVLIEMVDRVLYLVRVANGTFVIAGSRKVNLGTLRMRLAELLTKYQG